MSDPIVDILKEIVARVDNHTEFTELYYERCAAEIRAKLAKPVDEKLREEIARYISEFQDWDGARQYVKDGWLYKADSIPIALLPDAIREERTAIYKWGLEECPHVFAFNKRQCDECWEELKE